MVTAPISKTEKSLFLITLHSNAIKITNRDRKSKYSQMLFNILPFPEMRLIRGRISTIFDADSAF